VPPRSLCRHQRCSLAQLPFGVDGLLPGHPVVAQLQEQVKALCTVDDPDGEAHAAQLRHREFLQRRGLFAGALHLDKRYRVVGHDDQSVWHSSVELAGQFDRHSAPLLDLLDESRLKCLFALFFALHSEHDFCSSLYARNNETENPIYMRIYALGKNLPAKVT
jgi:hypothetical protein